uniref:Uncharacterized protein n=1 Tax=Mycena chlorophos TaxID=658473 RepID=A0ABQ0LCG7_MYCCL|nr:predicted protein [Mycena chlorophos]
MPRLPNLRHGDIHRTRPVRALAVARRRAGRTRVQEDYCGFWCCDVGGRGGALEADGSGMDRLSMKRAAFQTVAADKCISERILRPRWLIWSSQGTSESTDGRRRAHAHRRTALILF